MFTKFSNKKIFLLGLFTLVLIFGFGFSKKVEAATNVYYSVGQNVTDHKTGTPTVTIASGVATFSVAQTATNMGVGDKVTFNTTSVCYISAKQSTSVWNLITATGTACPDVTGATVDSIAHAFASLNAAVGLGVTGNATSTNFMNTSNIVTGNFILNIPVYYDSGADTTAVNISGYTTGASNYIKIYAPNNTTTEVNQSQRHSGIWSDTKYNFNYTATNGATTAFSIGVTKAIIDGLQIAYGDTTYQTGNVVSVGAVSANVTISNSIVKRSGTYARRGIYQNGFSSTMNVYNTAVYGFTGTSGTGIQTTGDGTQITNIYSSTIVNNVNGINTVDSSTIKNTYAQGSTAAYTGTFVLTTSASSDTTGTSGLQSIAYSTANFTNVTAGSEDLHIPSGSALKGVGTNTSGDSAPLNFTTDIDNEPRNGSWDVGADQYTVGADITAPTVDTFTIPATASSLTVNITAFTASDAVGVTGYIATTTSTAPLSSDTTWQATAPTTYTFSSAGAKTLYAWAKDAAGNVSTSRNASVTITLPADNFYITQNASGSDTGADCSNAHSIAWLDTANNWASPKEVGKIAPGDTIHLCGTFTGTGGQTLLTVRGSGSSGSPITIIFETGAQLNAPYWGSASNGAITISGKSYITIDGGSNGIIQNTANGTALANQQPSSGIYVTSSDHIEIKNLTIQHIYDNGGSDPYAQDVGGVHSYNINVYGNNNNISVHNNTLNNSRMGLYVNFDGTFTVDTINAYSNYVSDHAWGIAFGGGTGSPITTNISIYNNEITGWTNWQCPALTPSSHFCKLLGGGDQTSDTYHTDGMILFTVSGGTFAPLIYNNYIHGDLGGGSPTSFIYPTTGTSAKIFNNLLVQEGTRSTWMLNGSPNGSEIYNNTLVGWSGNSNNAIMLGGTGNKLKNNIIVNAGVAIASYNVLGTMISESDRNVWYNINSGNWRSSFNDGGTWYNWAQWQGLGYDLNSTTTNPSLNSSHYLQTGSSAIGLGADLTSVGITALNSDKLGNARPSGSAWDAGAYNYFVDNTAPTVTAFTIPATASSLTISISTFTASDAIGVTGYKLTESASAPLASDAGWTASAPTTHTFSSAGSKTLYAWAKDAAGNVSTSLNAPIVITLPSSTKAITAFDFNGLSPAVTGTVDETGKTIALTVPYGTTLTTLVPTITHTGASISPASGVSTNFTTPQTYTVTAANASTQDYVVTVSVGATPVVTPSGGGNGPIYGSMGGHRQDISKLLATTTTPVILTSTPVKYTFTRNLSLHATGADVKNLQKLLNSLGFTVAKTGAGSLGKETTLFGTLTYKALIKYQKSVGLPATGFFGPMTREYLRKK